MDREEDVLFIPYPVAYARKGGYTKEVLARRAYQLCAAAGCEMKTFDYEGIIEFAPSPSNPAGGPTYVWAALAADRRK